MKPQTTRAQIPKGLVGLESTDSFFTGALERLEHMVLKLLRSEGRRVLAIAVDYYSKRHYLTVRVVCGDGDIYLGVEGGITENTAWLRVAEAWQ